MQLYLSTPVRTPISDCADVEFTGTKLQTLFKGSLVESIDAVPGECYYVQPHGQTKYPTITKAEMPKTRGKKIVWALDFVQAKKHAESYEDFMERYEEVAKSYDTNNIFFEMIPGVYAFLLGEKKTKGGIKRQPLFAWVSDDINNDGLDLLITAYRKHRRLHCGEEFLRAL